MTKQEAGRKKKESEKKEQLDARSGKGNLAQDALAAQADARNEVKKGHEDAAKQLRKNVKDFNRDNGRKAGATKDPEQPSKKKKKVSAPKAKQAGIEATLQGEREVPEAGDSHGCDHSGLLELLPLERKCLQTCVKERGWLDKVPCFDCNKNKGEKNQDRVLNVAELLRLKGKQVLGVCCNCGPVGHKMVAEVEPTRKTQWSCDVVLCLECFEIRKKEMGDAVGPKRTRRTKKLN